MSVKHFFVHCNVLHLSFTLQLANVLQIDLQLVKVRFLYFPFPLTTNVIERNSYKGYLCPTETAERLFA